MVKSRVVVIGLDSAPLSLMLPWISKGKLPAFGKIFGSGSYGDLYSRIPVTPVAWSSIYTGKNPAHHGIFGFRNHKPHSYDDVGVNSTLRDAQDVWEIAGAHGMKAVVVNTPLTYPPRPVNGALVCGFMAPGPEYDFTYPGTLGTEIKKVVPDYRIGTAPSYIKGLYLKELHKTVQMVGDVSLHLLRQQDWDLAFIVFKETDEVQHSFFDRPGDMLGLYQRVDSIVGQIRELAGESSYTFVISDHGGEPVKKRFNVAEFMRRNGLISLNPTRPSRSSRLFQTAATTVFGMRMQWLLDLPGARRMLAQLVKIRARSGPGNDGFYGGQIDWKNTTAFISSGIGLRINLRGREPEGTVDIQDFEGVRNTIAKQFAEIVDPESGDRVFSYALPKEEVLSGPHLDDAPDILCLPNTGYLPTEALASFDPLAVAAEHRSLFSRSTLWCGTHSPTGLIAISGPAIKNSRLKAELEDVAPTILYAMGLPVPGDMDGRVVTDAFSPEHLASNPVVEGAASGPTVAQPHLLSEEEEKKVEDRLKQLGYL